MAETKHSNKNEKVGSVVGAKMAKTIVVEVTRRVAHPLYKRIVSKRKKFYAHDEEGRANVGDVVRIFFGVGGPNFTSSFHVIGEIFDKVYSLGGVLSQPLEGIQTVTVAPGGAVITEFKTKVPGNYTLVDHALARAERGLVGILRVEGPPNPDIYNGQVMSGMGH